MFLLNRKQLTVTTDPQECARITELLKRADLRHEVKTTTANNILSRNFSSVAAQRLNYTYSTMDRQSYVYYVYVPRRDYDKAKKAISGA